MKKHRAHLATQTELNDFFKKAITDPDVWPYLDMCQWYSPQSSDINEGSWNGFATIADSGKAICSVSISRQSENTATISAWSLNASSLSAGYAISYAMEFLKRHNPIAVKAICHSTNQKCVALLTARMGLPWGVEPEGAWDGSTGRWEDKLCFKKMLR